MTMFCNNTLIFPPRVRQLKEEPYSHKEAEAAAGLSTDNGKRDSQMVDSMLDVQEPAAVAT